jgi:hypothetical protein
MTDHDESKLDRTRAVEHTALLDHTPEVRAFVAAVRARLADLTEEEREELVGGLDADMSDLVAERGVQALPDPVAYAAELRSAAGFSPEAAAARGAARDRAMAWLDRGGATWNRWVDAGDHLGLPEFAHSLRPAWWVVRALCAAALVTEIWSSQGILGFTFNRGVVALAAIVVSVQIGRGAWWPGNMVRRSLTLRTLLIALNVFAVLLLPVMFSRFMQARGTEFVGEPVYAPASEGLTFRGAPVQNIYPYDALGRPLVGVQLVDQVGRRLPLEPSQYDDLSGVQKNLTPWMNGRTPLFSVFPLPEQSTDPNTGEPVGEGRMQSPPFASLPPVGLEGVVPSVLVPSSPPAVTKKGAVVQQGADATGRQKRGVRGSGG